MRVKIISDSTCDLSPALLERYDIAVTPLCVIKDGKDFHDGVDITPADIFAHVDGGGDLCSTSAVSQYEYGEMFARYANEYDAVVQITIGANFSCCYQNACAAAQEYENVFVVDSENLSTGQGLLVVAAAKLAEQGLSGAEIAERLEQNNVIVNYQATPDEEGFTASGALRMGVSEMTRFGFEEKDFDQLASLMADCILRGREIKADVEQLRARHTEMRYCFDDAAINDALEQLAGKLDI